MRVLVAAVALLMVSVVLSGCTANEPTLEVQGSSTSSSSVSASRSTTATQTGASNSTTTSSANQTGNQTTTAPNRAPLANLTANRTSGPAPLNVTFNLTMSDPDGNPLNWTLSFGHNNTAVNGTNLTMTLVHLFPAAGNYSARLNVTDGKNATSRSVNITVTAAAPTTPPEDLYVIFNFDGTCDAKNERTASLLHVHDRQSAPPQPGLVAGGGTWVYEESNGKTGLQVGGPDEDAPYKACLTPDTLIF